MSDAVNDKNFKITLSNADLRYILTVMKPVEPTETWRSYSNNIYCKCQNGKLRAYRTDRNRMHVVEVPYIGDEGDVVMPVLTKVPKAVYDVGIIFDEKTITLDYGLSKEIIQRPPNDFGEVKFDSVIPKLESVVPTRTPELTISMDVKFVADFVVALSKGKTKLMDLEYYGENKPFVLRVGDTFAVIMPIVKHEN